MKKILYVLVLVVLALSVRSLAANTYCLYFAADANHYYYHDADIGGGQTMAVADNSPTSYALTLSSPNDSATNTWKPNEGYYVEGWHLWSRDFQTAYGNSWPGGNSVTIWYSDLASLPTELTLIPYCRMIHYTLSFDVNGGTWSGSAPSSADHAYTDTVTLPTASKVGHTQSGWSASTGKTIASTTTTVNGNSLGVTQNGQSVTLTAQWTANVYNVTLNKNGGTCEDLTSYTYGVGATLPVATKADCSFDGWYENSVFSGSPITAISTTDTGGKEYWAKFTEHTYTLTTQVSPAAGGEITVDPPKAEFLHGDEVTLTATPYDGYMFDYWSITGYPKSTNEQCTITVTQTAYCTAYFKKPPVTYAITTAASPVSSGTVSGGGSYELGATVGLEATPNEGYSFEKWQDDPSASATRKIKVTGGATYTACFTGNVYTVTFRPNGGSNEPDDIDVRYGEKYGDLGEPTPPEGKSFSGWFTKKSGGDLITKDTIVSIIPPEEYPIMLYAHYEDIVYTEYYIVFDGNGATSGAMVVQTNAVDVATALNKNEYGKEGATFAGWATNVTGEVVYKDGETVTNIAAPGNTITLYAKWTPWKNYVEFDGFGETSGKMAVQEFEYGVPKALNANQFLKSGCTFLGWTNVTVGAFYTNQQELTFEQPNGTTNTLTAVWWANRYTIHFEPNANGIYGTMEDMSNCVSGVKTTLPPCAYTNLVSYFGGWAANETGGAVYKEAITYDADCDGEDKTLYAVWPGLNEWSTNVVLTSNAVLIADGNETMEWKLLGSWMCCTVQDKVPGMQWARMAMNVCGPGVLRFRWKTSSWTDVCHAYVSANGMTNELIEAKGDGIDIVMAVEESGLQTVTWFAGAYDYNAGGAPTMNVSAIRWNPGEQTRYDITVGAGVGGSVTGGGNYVVGTTAKLVATPADGYEFKGWSDGCADAARTVVVVSNATYTANFDALPPEAHYYYVAFDGNGATNETAMAVQKIARDTPTVLSANEYGRTGYAFSNWTDGTQSYDDHESVTNLADENKTNTLYVVWATNEYTIAFEKNATDAKGTMESVNCLYDTEVALPPNVFTRTGYDFAGWATNKTGAVVYVDQAAVSNLTAEAGGTVTLYATWGLETYTITYDKGDYGTGATVSHAYDYGAKIKLEQALFTRTGYAQAAWSKKPDGSVSGGNLGGSYTVVGDETFYPYWTANAYTVRFNKNADDATGSMADLSCTYGTEKKLTANAFKRTGYDFKGWATTSAGAVAYEDTATVLNLTDKKGDVVSLYAVWQETLSDLSIAVGLTNANLIAGTNSTEIGKWTSQGEGEGVLFSGSGSLAKGEATMSMTVSGPGTVSFDWEKKYRYNTSCWAVEVKTNGVMAITDLGNSSKGSSTIPVLGGSVTITWCAHHIGKLPSESIDALIKNVRWTPDAPVHPEPTAADARDISTISVSGDTVSLTVTNADSRFDYQLRGTNTLVELPWPVMWTTNGTGTIVIEPPKSDDPSMFYYLQTIQKQ